MGNNNEIFIDEKAGISIEEQKEILTQINGITERYKQQLSESGAQPDKKKKNIVITGKKGSVFPLAVNAAAVILLIGGALILFTFFGKADAQVRTGGIVYNLTERAVIEEIRRDTMEKISAKDKEIALILSRLEEVDNQLSLLQSSNQDLTIEQINTQERLLIQQRSYRDELAVLYDERSQILEDSWSREVRLRSQLDERNREFSVNQQRITNELDSAAGELERLSNERERTAVIDTQFTGSLAIISGLIQNGQYSQAAAATVELRYIVNNNSLTASRSFETRKEFYNQSLNSVEIIIAEMLKFQDINSEGLELYEKNLQLEQIIAEMQRNINTASSGSAGQLRRLNELEESVSTLRSNVSTLETRVTERDRTISALETRVTERDRTINSLETEKTQLTQTVTELQAANSAQGQEIINLRNQISTIRRALQDEN
ncbi:MAG: hypothetical protein FWD13_03880 [Treponema sp.]|nr:hypothetical protein [Treponema sp.]